MRDTLDRDATGLDGACPIK